MASRALTASDVVSALQEQNVEVAAGQVGQPPSPPGQNYQISVRAIGRLSEPVQFENIILKSNADGTLVRVHDVGRAELGAEDYGSDLQFNGHDAVGLGITQLSNANALEVDRKAIAELARLSQRFPPGMTYQLAFDTTDAVGESIRDVAEHALRSHRPGHHRYLHFPAGLAHDGHSLDHHSRVADWNVRVRQTARASRSIR